MKTKYLISLFFFLLSISNLHSQAYIYNYYGANLKERGVGFVSTPDSGFMIAAITSSFLENDNWLLIKANKDDLIEWSKVYSTGGYAHPVHIERTIDNDYVISGFGETGLGVHDAMLMKVDIEGNILWSKSMGGIDYEGFWKNSIDSLGNIISSGYTASFSGKAQDAYCVKFDTDGRMIWELSLGSELNESIPNNLIDDDNNYLFVGSTDKGIYGSKDGLVIKTDSSGNIIWSKQYGGDNYDGLGNVLETKDGGYLFIGNTYSFGLNGYILLLKTDKSGNVIWCKGFGNSKEESSYYSCLLEDGSVIVCGYTYSFGAGDNDAFLMKCDQNGDLIWFKTYGGISEDVAYFVTTDSLENILFTGWSVPKADNNEELFFVRTDSEGYNECYYSEASPNIVTINNLVETDFDYTINSSGSSLNPAVQTDSVELSNYNCFIDPVETYKSNDVPTHFTIEQNFPNPFNPTTIITYSIPVEGFYKIKIYDSLGQEVATLVDSEVAAGNYKISFNASGLASGMYIYSLKGNNVNISKKMLLLK